MRTLLDMLILPIAIMASGAALSVYFGPVWFLWSVWLLVVLFGIGTTACRMSGRHKCECA